MSDNTNSDDINKRLRDIEIRQAGLDSRVSASTTVFYAVSLLLAVLGSVAGYNLLTYRNFEVARDNVYRIMIGNLEKDIGNFFNSFAVRSPDKDMLARWQQLNLQIKSLDSVKVDDDRLDDIKMFFSIVGNVFQYGHKLPQ